MKQTEKFGSNRHVEDMKKDFFFNQKFIYFFLSVLVGLIKTKQNKTKKPILLLSTNVNTSIIIFVQSWG